MCFILYSLFFIRRYLIAFTRFDPFPFYSLFYFFPFGSHYPLMYYPEGRKGACAVCLISYSLSSSPVVVSSLSLGFIPFPFISMHITLIREALRRNTVSPFRSMISSFFHSFPSLSVCCIPSIHFLPLDGSLSLLKKKAVKEEVCGPSFIS